MTRRYAALGGTFAAMALSFGAVHHFEGHRPAQAGVMLAYAVTVLLLMRWGNRTPAQ